MNPSCLLSTAAAAMWLLCAPAQAQTQADNCEPIRAGIDARMRAGGLADPQLQVVDAGAALPGRVVGSCGNGTRKIVLTGSGAGTGAATSAPERPASAPVEAARPKPRPAAGKDDDIPTECRDGTVVMGPNCGDARAPRLPGVGVVANKPASAASR